MKFAILQSILNIIILLYPHLLSFLNCIYNFIHFFATSTSRKTKYRTGKDLYRWSQRKFRLFLQTKKLISSLVNKHDFYETNGSPCFPICLRYSLAPTECTKVYGSNVGKQMVIFWSLVITLKISSIFGADCVIKNGCRQI